MLRKPACHFGWDWNIAIAPLGLYGTIALRTTAAGPHRACRDRAAPSASTAAWHVDVDASRCLAPRPRHRACSLFAFAGEERRVDVAVSAGEDASRRHASPSTGRSSGGRPAAATQTLYPLDIACDGERGPPPHRLAHARAADRRGRGRRALCLSRQRPRDLLPRRQLDPGRRAAVTRNARADAKAARRRRSTPT